jgi:hypothetical protein
VSFRSSALCCHGTSRKSAQGTLGDEVLRHREPGAFRCRDTSVPYFAELAQRMFSQATILVRPYGSEATRVLRNHRHGRAGLDKPKPQSRSVPTAVVWSRIARLSDQVRRFCRSKNLIANPTGNRRITRPMHAPTASGVPI